MADFLIITGMVLWGLATISVILLAIGAFSDGDIIPGLVGVLLFAGSLAGIILTIDANGWFEDELPPDGCYHLSRETDYIPVSTGKVTTLTPVEDVTFTPVPCPGGGS